MSSVILPLKPALRMAESMASCLLQPCPGMMSGRYVAVRKVGPDAAVLEKRDFLEEAGAGVEAPEPEDELALSSLPPVSKDFGATAGFGR